jgi:maltose O-acetyltransferase
MSSSQDEINRVGGLTTSSAATQCIYRIPKPVRMILKPFWMVLITLADLSGGLWCRFEVSLVGSSLLAANRRGYWRAKLGAFGVDCNIYPSVVIHSPKSVIIGDRVNIAEFVHIWGGGGVQIGNDVAIASHVVIASQTHDKNAQLFSDSQRMMHVKIGKNVWIGSGAVILPGVRIGEGSVIGAQAVVTGDVPPRSVVLGVPGRVVERLQSK